MVSEQNEKYAENIYSCIIILPRVWLSQHLIHTYYQTPSWHLLGGPPLHWHFKIFGLLFYFIRRNMLTVSACPCVHNFPASSGMMLIPSFMKSHQFAPFLLLMLLTFPISNWTSQTLPPLISMHPSQVPFSSPWSGGSVTLQNTDILPHHCTVSQPKRPWHDSSWPWKLIKKLLGG